MELGAVFDAAFCEKCEGDATLKEVESSRADSLVAHPRQTWRGFFYLDPPTDAL